MKTFLLKFDGYWSEAHKENIPEISGVYCVYSYICKTGNLDELIYIGESENVHSRLSHHEKLDDWKRGLSDGHRLCYSAAPVAGCDRERVESALIFKTQPPYNKEHTESFIYEDTEITTSGKNYLLPAHFVVKKGETQ